MQCCKHKEATILPPLTVLLPAAAGPLRVCLPQNRPGVDTFSLSVARAFGDLVLAPAGVVPVPDFSVFRR